MLETTSSNKKFEKQLDGGLLVRELAVSDRFELFDLVRANAERVDMFAPGLSQRLDSPDRIADWLQAKADARTLEKEFGLWEDGTLAGAMSLALNQAGDTAFFGYWLGHQYEGKGIATRCSRVLIDYAFGLPEVESVKAMTALENQKSQKVMGRLGLKSQGIEAIEGSSFEHFMTTKADWKAGRNK